MRGGGQDERVGKADGPILGSVHVPACGEIEDVIVEMFAVMLTDISAGVPRMVMAEMKLQAREAVVGSSPIWREASRYSEVELWPPRPHACHAPISAETSSVQASTVYSSHPNSGNVGNVYTINAKIVKLRPRVRQGDAREGQSSSKVTKSRGLKAFNLCLELTLHSIWLPPYLLVTHPPNFVRLRQRTLEGKCH